MHKNKRGLSTVISTLIIIGLSLVAITIVWVVVSNILSKGAEDISLNAISVDLDIKKVYSDGSNLIVDIKRNPGSGTFDSLKFFVSDGASTDIFDIGNSSLNELEEKTFSLPFKKLINSNFVSKISVAPIVGSGSSAKVVQSSVKELKLGKDNLANVGWVKYHGNPIFQNVSSNLWESLLVTSPIILKNLDGTPYKDSRGYWMYYTGGQYDIDLSGNPTVISLDQMGLVTSQDLFNWNRVQSNPVLSISNSPSYDHGDVQAGTVLYNGTHFLVWYSSNQYNYAQSQAVTPKGDNVTISFATSTDGINWVKYSGNPILVQGLGDDSGDMYGPVVIKDENVWKMWYSGHNSAGHLALMYATSNNSYGPWTRYSNNYIFDPGYDIFPLEVWRDTGIYYMFFFDENFPTSRSIRLATSPDGISWFNKGVVFIGGQVGDWDKYVFGVSQVNVNNKWYTFYSGYSTSPESWGIGVAISPMRVPNVKS
jgi:predicted GH43/DUF377 family glycosyl hydrolase